MIDTRESYRPGGRPPDVQPRPRPCVDAGAFGGFRTPSVDAKTSVRFCGPPWRPPAPRSPPVSAYVPLWCKTNFSFLEGASHPEELIEHAQAVGVTTLAITDRDGVPGIVRAHVAAKEHGVRIVVGSEITIRDGSTLVLLAQDRAGYANLCRLVTKGRLRSAKGSCVVEIDEVAAHAAGLCALWTGDPLDPSLLHDAFGGRLYARIARHRRRDRRLALHDHRFIDQRRAVLPHPTADHARRERGDVGRNFAGATDRAESDRQAHPTRLTRAHGVDKCAGRDALDTGALAGAGAQLSVPAGVDPSSAHPTRVRCAPVHRAFDYSSDFPRLRTCVLLEPEADDAEELAAMEVHFLVHRVGERHIVDRGKLEDPALELDVGSRFHLAGWRVRTQAALQFGECETWIVCVRDLEEFARE